MIWLSPSPPKNVLKLAMFSVRGAMVVMCVIQKIIMPRMMNGKKIKIGICKKIYGRIGASSFFMLGIDLAIRVCQNEQCRSGTDLAIKNIWM